MKVVAASKETGESLADSVQVARSAWSRFWGLMMRRHLPHGHGLLIDPCSSVHTMFMRFPIDVIYLDRENRVVKIAADMKPYRASIGRGARSVLEVNGGVAAEKGLTVGDRVVLTESPKD
ncbi:MAG TPA: DUF192 domain-containing protein [Rhodothermales bacterium]|nr:DUF192 domain-containing protein [Rhodothermales bacterium]